MPPFATIFAAGPETARLLAEMLIVIAAAKVMAEVAAKLRQPPVAGELLLHYLFRGVQAAAPEPDLIADIR